MNKYNNISHNDNSIIITLSKFLIPTLFIFAGYIHLFGSVTPGGGFQAGAIITCSFLLYFLITYFNENKKFHTSQERVTTIISTIGIIIYIGVGIVGIFEKNHRLFNNKGSKHQHLYNDTLVDIIELAIAIIVFSSITRILISIITVIQNDVQSKLDN